MKLEDFEKDYKNTKKPIENITFYNIKTFFKRQKLSFKLYKKIFGPVVITSMISLPTFKVMNLGAPFELDEHKIYNYKIQSINNDIVGYEYIDIKQKTFIKLVNEWEPYGDIYVREIEYYELDDINKFNNLNDLKKIKTEKEFASNPDSKDGSYDILFYDRINDQYNVISESESKNQLVSGLYLTLVVLALMYGVEKYIEDNYNFELNELYPYINFDTKKTLEKQLKKKEENLKFLKGDNDEIKRTK